MSQPVRVVKARLKFDADIPIALETVLTTKYGFVFFSRKRGGWTEYEKMTGTSKPRAIKFDDLPNEVINDLTRRVNKIVDSFADPDAHKDVVRARCSNLAKTLEPKKRAWVEDWIRRNIDGDDDLPWFVDVEELQAEIQEKLF